EIRLERVELPAKGVALHGDVHHSGDRMGMAGNIFREEDRAGTRAPHRHAVGHALAQLGDDLVALGELADRRARAPRDDERGDVIKLRWTAHVYPFGSDPLEGAQVLGEIALEAEDADASGLGWGFTSRGRQDVR